MPTMDQMLLERKTHAGGYNSSRNSRECYNSKMSMQCVLVSELHPHVQYCMVMFQSTLQRGVLLSEVSFPSFRSHNSPPSRHPQDERSVSEGCPLWNDHSGRGPHQTPCTSAAMPINLMVSLWERPIVASILLNGSSACAICMDCWFSACE